MDLNCKVKIKEDAFEKGILKKCKHLRGIIGTIIPSGAANTRDEVSVRFRVKIDRPDLISSFSLGGIKGATVTLIHDENWILPKDALEVVGISKRRGRNSKNDQQPEIQ